MGIGRSIDELARQHLLLTWRELRWYPAAAVRLATSEEVRAVGLNEEGERAGRSGPGTHASDSKMQDSLDQAVAAADAVDARDTGGNMEDLD